MKTTFFISQKTVDALPPLFPIEKGEKVRRLLAEEVSEHTAKRLKKELIKLNYELWPYRRAWQEYLAGAEEEMVSHFLFPGLSPELSSRCQKYHECGVGFFDFYSGRVADYFSTEERNEITALLSSVKSRAAAYAKQRVLTTGKKDYLRRVKDYEHILKKLKKEIDRLKKIAVEENDHPIIANEINTKVEAFEEGLALLGPEINHREVFNAVEFFAERKNHLNSTRGIHTSQVFDFYN